MESKLLAGIGLVNPLSHTQVNSERILQIVSSLSMFQLFILKISGSVLIGDADTSSRRKLPFYLMKCNRHGYQLSYPSGFDEVLICPKCLEMNRIDGSTS